MSLPEREAGAGFRDDNSSSPDRLELKITSDPANLSDVRKRIEQFAQRARWPRESCDAIGLVVNEALANVIRHGYGGATDRPIVVTAEVLNDALRISIRDWAKPFDPSALPERDVCEVRPGGLGLLCMRTLMDEVKYERLSDGMLLKLTKKKTPTA